jgi:hypothetical protein
MAGGWSVRRIYTNLRNALATFFTLASRIVNIREETITNKISIIEAEMGSGKSHLVTGNVEGLQLLNQQSTMMAGELVEIKTALLTQSAERNSDSINKQNGIPPNQ